MPSNPPILILKPHDIVLAKFSEGNLKKSHRLRKRFNRMNRIFRNNHFVTLLNSENFFSNRYFCRIVQKLPKLFSFAVILNAQLLPRLNCYYLYSRNLVQREPLKLPPRAHFFLPFHISKRKLSFKLLSNSH